MQQITDATLGLLALQCPRLSKLVTRSFCSLWLRICTHSLSFWATVCKTVCPYAIGPLSVCLSCPVCLSLTLVHCGQTVGRIKMKLGMQVGLGPGHIVLDGDPAPPLQRGTAPLTQFLAHVCCGQRATWIKMLLGMEVSLGPGDFAFNGDPAPPQKKTHTTPNGWMDHDATWYGGKARPR